VDSLRGAVGVGEPQATTEPSLADAEQIVRSFIGMMSVGGISELDVAVGTVSIRLRAPLATDVVRPVPVDARGLVPPPIPESPVPGHTITAPMIGTFYTAATPGGPVFVQVGDRVESGQVIGIIEAMKIMNEIVADHSGVVIELVAQNSQPVEYGSPLVRLDIATLGSA